VHPILRRRGRLRLYLAAWALVGLLLTALLALAGGLGWREAAALGVPLALAFSQLALSAWYVCRAAPLGSAGAAALGRAAITVGAAAVVASGLWLAVGRLLAEALAAAVPAFGGLGERFAAAGALVFGVGVPLYLLAAAAHYVALAVDASQAARRRALELEVLARDAELRALRAQLDPHFLFNSLNAVAALAGSDPAGARRMALMLADLLRRGLRLAERRSIPLADELELARAYLAIEAVRFGDRLAVAESLDPAAGAVQVPPRILQPLVENAIKHGIAGLLGGGTVRLESERRGGAVSVAVENDRDPDAPARPGEGLGLANVRGRLAAAWGGDAWLVVRPEPGRFRAEILLSGAAVADAGEPEGTGDAMAAGEPAAAPAGGGGQ
jgi:hypothetical protein